MKTLTFAFDVQLNDFEDWIKEGTKIKVSDNPFHINKHEGFTPVIVTEAYDFDGGKIKIDPYVEWFMNESFVELREGTVK